MGDNLFHLQPWEPKLSRIAEDLTAKIHTFAPNLEVLFMGAAALGLPGKNDIDLDILCDSSEVDAYVEKLFPVLGAPKEKKEDLVSWRFTLDGCEIDCIISDPKFSHVPAQRRRFEILKANPKLLNEYKELKEACDGLPLADYEQRKMAFFEKIYPSER